VGVSTNTAVACALAHAHVVGGAILVASHHGESAFQMHIRIFHILKRKVSLGTFSLQNTSAPDNLCMHAPPTTSATFLPVETTA
jgi:hypothetical protein